ncbi:LADA_0G04302g1_1 [Lachancea dasiensis]|uniref:LADA_0G04302g1_1 n=1 Tax=Lachancea dasiensis TaxID=1072105 RepID=A0A1G4JS26_9SACH|nr:LADA_0G04302g1_1 [Lachancea dasiensis]
MALNRLAVSIVFFFAAILTQHFTNALPVLEQLPKRQIVTRMHTASTTNIVTDFYSTTTQIEVAPTVEFIISGDATFTTTLPQADGSTPTGNPTTTVMVTVQPQNENAAEPNGLASSSSCTTTITTGAPKGTVYVSPLPVSATQSSNPQLTASTLAASSLVASASVLPPQAGSATYEASSSSSLTPTPPSPHIPAPPASTTSGFESATSKQPDVSSSNAQESAPSSSFTSTSEEATSTSSSYGTTASSTEQTTSTSTTVPTSSSYASTTSTTPIAASSSGTTSSTSSTTSGQLHSAPTALVYSPYNNDNTCKDSSSVYQDMKFIKSKGVSKVRIYGTDCNSLETITSAAKSLGITINQGLWITSAGVDSIDDAVNDVLAYGKSNGWDLFDVLTIGNEAVLSGYCSVDDLVAKISSVRSKFESAGFTGKYTTSEPPVTFQNHPSLCKDAKIDFVGINSHAYFDVNSSADSAGTFVKGQLELIQQVCGTNNVVVTETGYPSGGNTNGGNIPSHENQLEAIQNILNEMNGEVTVLSTFNDYWKQPGPYGIEQFFGISDILASA